MFIDTSKQKRIKKGTILQLEGDSQLKSYFVIKGLLRSYIIDEKGKEHVFMFAPENWFMGDILAYSSSTPTRLFIDALEDSDVVPLQQTMDNLTPEDLRSSIEKLLKRAGVLQNRVLMHMSSSALERYQHFMDVYPQLIHRVPQKMIASYLGITPQALSRIRSDWAKSEQ
ncbi:Crp/Fnr family transcriptional regulator [bacterium SCSIO 12741]|nr:Crp/Fnr family transcriptional regulator [bacterium SCSIO 12741]